MRLAPDEIAAIKAAARAAFGPAAVVRLFGSRVHDHLRGGDTDLLIEWDGGDEWAARAKFEDAFAQLIEPRRVDIVVATRGEPPTPIEEIARRDGVLL
jgi:predicted nucleotidyltransferase